MGNLIIKECCLKDIEKIKHISEKTYRQIINTKSYRD